MEGAYWDWMGRAQRVTDLEGIRRYAALEWGTENAERMLGLVEGVAPREGVAGPEEPRRPGARSPRARPLGSGARTSASVA